MAGTRREKLPRPWKKKDNDSTPSSGYKKVAMRRGKHFGRVGGWGKENSQTSGLGEGFGEGLIELIRACENPVKKIDVDVRRNSMRIHFALGSAGNRIGDLKKHQQVSSKRKIGQDREKAMQALRDELDKLKRLFELKKWHSNTLETWVYPREETRRSLDRLIRAMDAEYQLLCKRKAQEKKAQELKEEGFADSEASDASKVDDPESLAVVEAEDLVPAGKDEEVPASSGENEEDGDSDQEEEDGDVDEDDEPKGNSSATIDGQKEEVQGVMVKEKPERFTRHVGKQVLLPAGAFGEKTEQTMIEVADVYAVVRAEEAEVKKHQAECVWVYDIRRTEDGKFRLVSCVDMLQFLVPKGLLKQEKKMATALSNARGMNFDLGNRLMKHEARDELQYIVGSWWYEKG